MKIAFQGERGAFSEVIIHRLYQDATPIPCKTFKDVFTTVELKKADIAVIPVENSLTGKINEPTNLLMNSDLKIIREGMLRIVHCLIANKNEEINDIQRIYAHPEALLQCKKYLNMLDTELISWYDGAGASKNVKQQKYAGLVASEEVAKIYDLQVLKRGIQNSKKNITRFFFINRQEPAPTGDDKTTLYFSTFHKPGALFHALEPFSRNKVNLTRLESMPSKDEPWQYLFLVDIEGHKDDPVIKQTFKELEEVTVKMKILGSYPRGSTFE